MSATVCQNLLPCFESQVTETAIMLKLSPQNSTELGRHADTKESINLDQVKGWSFLQSLSNISGSPGEKFDRENSSYVHPLSQRSSFSRLSEKSLELCTENLGSETGTDILDSSIFSLPTSNSSREISSPEGKEREEKKQSFVGSRRPNKPANSARNFPPPLTSLSGSNSLQVRPHREDGRLIIKAVETPLKNTFLQAERSHGRLRLCFLKNFDSEFNSEMEEENEFDGGDDDVEEYESDMNDEENQEESESGEESEEEEEGEEMNQHQVEEKEEEEEENELKMDGYNNSFEFDVDVEMGREKFQRIASRCKENGHGNKGLCNWKPPLWVATS